MALALALAPALSAQVSEHRLPNGLQVLVRGSADPREIEVTTGYFVGGLDGDLRGAAHLLEHLAMRETRAGQSSIDGGAFTTPDVTVFSLRARGAAAMLDTLLALQRQRMTSLAVTEAALLAERRSLHTEVDGRATPPWTEALLGPHRLRLAGRHDDVDRITRGDLLAFYRRYYTPRNAALVIAASLPESLVVARVAAAFGALPPGPPVPRPVFRDSSRLASRAWTGVAEGTRYLVITVPGIQDPARQVLEAALSRERAGLAGRQPPVTIRLLDEAPASTLVLSTPDSGIAAERLNAALERLAAAAREASPPAGASNPSSDRLLRCEAAGSWRFCFADSTITEGARTRLVTVLSAARTDSAPVVLWPAPLRPAPRVAPYAPNALVSGWATPDPRPIAWRRTEGGLEWESFEGGRADSVFVALLLAPSRGGRSVREVAALEMWARSWGTLRVSSGETADSLFARAGVSASVRPLPFPPLATADAFVSLSAAPTPLGLHGLEFLASASREAAPLILPMLRRVLAEGALDEAAFGRLRSEQLNLLREKAEAAPALAQLAARQWMIAGPDSSRPLLSPAQVTEQIAAMATLTVQDVAAAGRDLLASGAARLAVLGADQAATGRWLAASGLDGLGTLGGAARPACPPADSATLVVRAGESRPQTTLFALACSERADGPEQEAALTVANAALGGTEDALLARRLRTELGMAYFFRSRIIPVWNTPLVVWMLEIQTPAATVSQAIGEIRAVLAAASAVGPSAGGFESARRAAANARRSRSQDGLPWVGNVVWKGLSPEQEAGLIDAVAIDDVLSALRRFARPEVVRVIHTAGAR